MWPIFKIKFMVLFERREWNPSLTFSSSKISISIKFGEVKSRAGRSHCPLPTNAIQLISMIGHIVTPLLLNHSRYFNWSPHVSSSVASKHVCVCDFITSETLIMITALKSPVGDIANYNNCCHISASPLLVIFSSRCFFTLNTCGYTASLLPVRHIDNVTAICWCDV